MKIKNDFTVGDLVLVGVTILLAGLMILGLGFDFMSIGVDGIYFNF
ncbi:MAG: hypothetical protein ACOC2W_02875 [bacterium]